MSPTPETLSALPACAAVTDTVAWWPASGRLFVTGLGAEKSEIQVPSPAEGAPWLARGLLPAPFSHGRVHAGLSSS